MNFAHDRFKSVTLVLVLLGLAGPPAMAQPTTGGLTLHEAIRTALAHNRLLNAARQQEIAARAGGTQARAALLPRLDAEETFSETNNPTLVFSNLLNQQRFTERDFDVRSLNHPSSLSNFNTRFRVEQPLFAGGKLIAGLEAATAGINAAVGQQTRAAQETVFQTKQAYYGVLLADKSLVAVDDALAAARQQSATAQAMLERGVVIRSDVLRAEVLVGNLERQRIDANNATQWSRSRLAYIIGSPLEIPLADHDAWPELGEPSSLEESTRIALERRPDLQALENQWRASEAALRQARGDYLPSVGVVGQYELNSKELERFGDSYAVFVGARWNLFNGLATNGKVSEANANATRARMMRDDLAARIRVEVEEAWRGLAGATTQIQVAQRSGAQAKENLAILRDRYSTGLSKSVDVLDAVATAAQADLEILRAQVNRQLRRAELDLATGEPVPAADTEEQ